MNGAAFALPTGRQGRGLAIGITLLGAAFIWFVLISPLLGWYEARAATLAAQQTIAAHMTALVQQIPQLRAKIAASRPAAQDQQILLPAAPDAIAGANLQSTLQTLAAQAGTSLDSAEILPVQPAGNLRRVSIQVSLTAPWPALIAFLTAISTAQPRLLVGQISLTSAAADGGAATVQANFVVSGYSAGPP